MPAPRNGLGWSPDGLTPEGLTPDALLALVEISPWRIAPGWADTPLTDRRAKWTSLAAEATQTGNTVADVVEELADLEERGLLKWAQEPQTALLAANLDEALSYLDQQHATADRAAASCPQTTVTADSADLDDLPCQEDREPPGRAETDSRVQRILPPSRDEEGRPSAAWLLVQAAQLAIETTSVLRAINGAGMNLSEEISAQSQVAALLANAAHAMVISRVWDAAVDSVDLQPPPCPCDLRPCTGSRQRHQLSGARLRPAADAASPPRDLVRACAGVPRRPDPDVRCAGTTKQGQPCARTIFRGIGSRNCHDHFSAAEQQRRDLLQEARARVQDAEAKAANAQRWSQAEWWVKRYR